ncbi:MAG: trehalose-phosphatase [Pseudochelatococcus sp.]|jgi:trehalose 6-phosphate phosphatase|uniref:trehalose-phosphatase n=1 Tax=Pseudochelatococcus sp. TaxID=2020869 RepID=UPI003D94EAAF
MQIAGGNRPGEAAAPPSFPAWATDAPVLTALAENPAQWALFLDIDGTLVDIALTPDTVDVPAGLTDSLAAVMRGLGGAMALVTGRATDFVDGLFHPHRFPLAGLHGAQMRLADGRRRDSEPGPALLRAKDMLRAGVRNWPGVLFEDKGAAVALHFRLAPQQQEAVENLMRDAAVLAGPKWALQRGKMVIELKPAAADKGAALRSFMDTGPFLGRWPVAIGDDLTDEDMFATAIALGGQAVRVGKDARRSLASGRLQTPAQLREALAGIRAMWEKGRPSMERGGEWNGGHSG